MPDDGTEDLIPSASTIVTEQGMFPKLFILYIGIA